MCKNNPFIVFSGAQKNTFFVVLRITLSLFFWCSVEQNRLFLVLQNSLFLVLWTVSLSFSEEPFLSVSGSQKNPLFLFLVLRRTLSLRFVDLMSTVLCAHCKSMFPDRQMQTSCLLDTSRSSPAAFPASGGEDRTITFPAGQGKSCCVTLPVFRVNFLF